MERGGREKFGPFKCLWKMNHGGRHRGRSRKETHLARTKNETIGRKIQQKTLLCHDDNVKFVTFNKKKTIQTLKFAKKCAQKTQKET